MTDAFLVNIIADYCDDNAFSRVRQKLRQKLLDGGVEFHKIQFQETWVPPFDTRATGFNLADLARNSKIAREGIRHVFYVNTAPRKDKIEGRKNNAGEKLLYLKLKNGVEIVAVNSGDSLAFLSDAATTVSHLDISDRGSQFRSLRVFPDALRRMAMNDETLFTGDATADLPDFPAANSINLIEGYGNIKTNIRADHFDENLYGKTIHLSVNGMIREAKVCHRLFENAEDSGLIMYEGSSGWERENGKEVRYMEIAWRGASAAEALKNPDTGATLENGMDFDFKVVGDDSETLVA